MFFKIIKQITPLFMIDLIKRIFFFFNWDQWMNISYSQEGEDILLKRIFENKQYGFYVDVGAHHPKRFSNTYLLYQKGWKGINIDALPGSMKTFNTLRPRDINLEIGVGEKEGFINYYVFNEPALNSFSKELSNKIDKEKNIYFIKQVIKIQVKRLDNILDSHLLKSKIDFLNVDVEGLDLDVLKSNDWFNYRPKFVLVEITGSSIHDLDKHPISKFMSQNNYIIFAKQINTIFFKDINEN
jgi:FkbM family methyltransferase